MKNILIFNGSPRRNGNTSAMISHFVSGAQSNNATVEILYADELNLNYCIGCLRCNMLGKCSKSGDDWEKILEKMENADVLVFASPVYFHHITAQLKKLIDRFRCLVHVQITETGLIHTPQKQWKKEMVLLLSMGTPDDADAQPAIEMFRFIQSFLSPAKKPHVILGKRLAVINQLNMPEHALKNLYAKLKLSENLSTKDFIQNTETAKKCFFLGQSLSLSTPC